MRSTEDLRRPEHWARFLGFSTLVGLEFGIIGPFGSYPANAFTRLIYWLALFWIGTVLLVPAIALAREHGNRRGFPMLFSGALGVVVACVPLAALAAAAC